MTRRRWAISLALTAGLAPATAAQDAPAWSALEAHALTDHIQLTFAEDFAKAGEAYFSPDERWIIFQAVPTAEATATYSPHYAMYVAKLIRDASGRVTAIEEPIRLSAPGSANTCGWFHPTVPGLVLFGSTQRPPAADEQAGYQRESSDYRWVFHRETEIVSGAVRAIIEDSVHEPYARTTALARPDLDTFNPIFERDGYAAECTWSPDGRSILYTWVDPATGDGDLWIYDVLTQEQTPIVTKPGYDGGPFFSPDGRFITYRSDRVGNDLLQIFVAELDFNAEGRPAGIVAEHQLTDDTHVNWAPYWTPDGRGLIYTSSRQSHFNYELYTIPFDPANPARRHEPVRLTHAEGFDGLAVVSPSGRDLLWTAQRGGDTANRGRPTSQLWIARITDANALVPRPEWKAETPAPPAAERPTMPEVRVRFGIRPADYDDTGAGVAVGGVSPGSPAEAAGLRPGDRITHWNGRPLADIDAWIDALARQAPGDVVILGVLRDGAPIELRATLAGRDG